MELFNITLAANQTQTFMKAGRYFEVIDSIAPINVSFYGDAGQLSDVMVGALSGLFLEDPFSSFQVTNGANPQTVTILLMETGRGGSRRQPGVVRVVDSSRELVAANKKFFGTITVPTPAAGLFSQAQIWNGSTQFGLAVKNLVLTQSDLAQSVEMVANTATLAGGVNGYTGLPSKKLMSSALISPTSIQTWKKVDAASSGQGGVNAISGNLLAKLQAAAGVQRVSMDLLDGPLVLAPGMGLVAASSVAQSAIAFYFEAELFDWAG